MIHARKDYNRIQDPALNDIVIRTKIVSSPIAEDEPVFLIRGKDKFFILMLKLYKALVWSNPIMVESLNGHISYSEKWRKINGTKSPDMKKSDITFPSNSDYYNEGYY